MQRTAETLLIWTRIAFCKILLCGVPNASSSKPKLRWNKCWKHYTY